MGTALKHLLLIEPQELFTPYLVTTLEESGLWIVAAVPRIDLGQIALLGKPDVILVDMMRSDASNFMMLRHIRRAFPRVRLVVFGGSRNPVWQENAWAEGVNALLTECDGPAELIEAAKGPQLAA
jgi:DNA-binding NarL/FixJ family response regulator